MVALLDQGVFMAFVIKNTASEKTKDVRLSLPISMADEFQTLADESGVDFQEALRQGLAYALKASRRASKKNVKESAKS